MQALRYQPADGEDAHIRRGGPKDPAPKQDTKLFSFEGKFPTQIAEIIAVCMQIAYTMKRLGIVYLIISRTCSVSISLAV